MLSLFAEQLRTLVELGVLHGDRELRGQRGQERRVVLREQAAAFGERAEQSDHIVVGQERYGNRGFDAGLGGGVPDSGEPGVGRDVMDHEDGARAERAERELQEPVGEPCVRTGEPEARGRVQAALLPEVDGEPIHPEQLADPLHGRFQCVRQRELRDRLSDHRQ